MTNKKKLALAALGGTISMTPSETGGIDSKVGAEDLIAKLPELAQLADIQAETLASIGSCNITFEHLFHTLHWAETQLAKGADGIIISQGTDTLEQSAFFFDLYWQHKQPLILTGAMRGAAEVGFDGLANLMAAAITAISPDSYDRGVLTVLNDTVHNARFVTKSNTTAMHTFTSPIHGPCAIVNEGKVHYLRQNTHKPRFPIPAERKEQVQIIAHGIDDHAADIVRYCINHPTIAGLVIEGVGSGHVAIPLRDALIEAVQTMPIIMCSRTGSGGR